MGLDRVVEDILRRGEGKRKDIISLGKTERDEQIRQAEMKIVDERQKADKRVQAAIAQMDQQEISSAELESKKALLAAQRQVMEELKEQVLDELEKYPTERRKKLYAKLVAKAKAELGECLVYTNKGDKALVSLPPGMTNAGVIDCRGGLVFESKNKNFRLDYRFESLLEDMWNARIREIYTKLFG